MFIVRFFTHSLTEVLVLAVGLLCKELGPYKPAIRYEMAIKREGRRENSGKKTTATLNFILTHLAQI